MPIRGHEIVPIPDYNGLWARGKGLPYDGTLSGWLSVPNDHLVIANNLRYFNKGFGNRETYQNVIAQGESPGPLSITGNVVRFFIFRFVGDTKDRHLILWNDGVDSHLNDDLNTIFTWAGRIIPDMAILSAANRVYISPHDRETGISGLNVLVYNPTDGCREACGATPTTGPLGVQSHNRNFTDADGSGGGYTTPTVPPNSNVGNVPKGQRLFAYCFETSTGFVTAPGPNNGVSPHLTPAFTIYTATNATRKVDIYNVPTGPTGTIARRILATQTIKKYDGNQKNWELFFVPGGRIPNNTIVGTALNPAITLNFYDTDLVSSGEYLLDQLERMPAVVSFFYFNARMLGLGQYNTTDAPTNSSIAIVSKSAQVESFDKINGIISVYPDDVNGSLKSAVDYHGILHTFKSSRSYAIQDTGQDPIDWTVTLIEAGIGCECHGVATILDAKGQSQERFLIIDKSGLLQFAGIFSERPISYKIDDLWTNIRLNTSTNIQNQMQVCVDPVSKRVYVLLPNDSSLPSSLRGAILMGDYSEGHPQAPFSSLGGLTWDIMKWSIWTFAHPVISIAVGNWLSSTNIPTLKLIFNDGSGTYTIQQMIPPSLFPLAGDANETVTCVAEFGPLTPDGNEGMLSHFGEIRGKFIGNSSGGLQLLWSVRKEDDGTVFAVPSGIGMVTPSGVDTFRPINAVSERVSLRIESFLLNNNTADYFICKSLNFYAKQLWSGRPSQG